MAERIRAPLRHRQLPADYLGKRLWDVTLLTPLDGGWEPLKRRVGLQKRIQDFVVSATISAGDTRYAEIAGMPKFDDDGDFAGYWGTAKDVTHRVARNCALPRANANTAAPRGSPGWAAGSGTKSPVPAAIARRN